jgi:hypothetical protein
MISSGFMPPYFRRFNFVMIMTISKQTEIYNLECCYTNKIKYVELQGLVNMSEQNWKTSKEFENTRKLVKFDMDS